MNSFFARRAKLIKKKLTGWPQAAAGHRNPALGLSPPYFLIFFFNPKNAVECPLETSAKDDLARHLSPHNFVPIENLTFTSP